MFSSCVAPYDSGAGYSVTTTSYRPGHVIHRLPPGYRTEVIGGVSYYRHHDTYYRRNAGRYVVVESPRQYDRRGASHGAVITRLPSGYRTVRHRGTTYYQHRGTYYAPRGDRYVIVPNPY